MMPENTTSNTESNTIRTVMTTSATRQVAHTRIGTATFLATDAQFAEPTDTDD